MGLSYGITGILMPLAAAALLAGACATGPARPLMSAWDKESGFGYSERRIEESRMEVTYVGPFLRTHFNPKFRADDVKKFRALAEDLALWRAADLAKAGNYPALEIVRTNTDITIESYEDRPRIFRYRLAHSRGGYRYEQIRVPGFRSAWLQAKAVIVVVLKRKRGEKDLDADETAKRLAKKHHGARTLPAY